MRLNERNRRTVLLAMAAIVSAFSSATAVIAVQLYGLPPTDEPTFGLTVWDLWTESSVLFFAIPFALSGAWIWFAASLELLWRTDLRKSVPAVFLVTVVAATLTGNSPLLAVAASLVCGTGAMALCRKRFASARVCPWAP